MRIRIVVVRNICAGAVVCLAVCAVAAGMGWWWNSSDPTAAALVMKNTMTIVFAVAMVLLIICTGITTLLNAMIVSVEQPRGESEGDPASNSL